MASATPSWKCCPRGHELAFLIHPDFDFDCRSCEYHQTGMAGHCASCKYWICRHCVTARRDGKPIVTEAQAGASLAVAMKSVAAQQQQQQQQQQPPKPNPQSGCKSAAVAPQMAAAGTPAKPSAAATAAPAKTMLAATATTKMPAKAPVAAAAASAPPAKAPAASAAAKPPSSEPPPLAYCQAGHKIQLYDMEEGWKCTTCKSTFGEDVRALSCDCDGKQTVTYCRTCARRRCPGKNHVLQFLTQAANWTCKQCSEAKAATDRGVGCAKCAFVVCVPCANKMTVSGASTTTPAAASAATGTTTTPAKAPAAAGSTPAKTLQAASPATTKPPAHAAAPTTAAAAAKQPASSPATTKAPAAAPGRPAASAAKKPPVASHVDPAAAAVHSGGAAAPTGLAIAEQTKKLCQAGHPLQPQKFVQAWGCDCCHRNYEANIAGLGCRICNKDMCPNCARLSFCPQRHMLLFDHDGKPPGPWKCGRCWSEFPNATTISSRRYRCAACAYSACSGCFRVALASPNVMEDLLRPTKPALAVHPVPPPANDKGRHRALFVGIDYVGLDGELRGCINDVGTMQLMVEALGWKLEPEQCRVLIDDRSKYHGKMPATAGPPTRENILAGLRWLVAGAKSGDSLFFHYSGHGARVADKDGDEDDGFDEVLVPVDYETEDEILDDEIFDIVCKHLPKGVRLTAVADCCHSGSIMDLQYQWRWNGESFAPKGAARGFTAASKKRCEADVMLISGCKDNQVSMDTFTLFHQHRFKIQGQHHGGALTNGLAECIKGPQTFGSILELLLTNLKKNKYDQLPQLTCSQIVDLNAPFSLFGPVPRLQ